MISLLVLPFLPFWGIYIEEDFVWFFPLGFSQDKSMLFLCVCDFLCFSDLLAYGYAVMMLNVLRSDITIKNSTGNTFYKGHVNWEFLRKVDSHPIVDLKVHC